MNQLKKLPELLLPAGNVENFRAAVAAGADAVYLGLQKFNARGRASNFSNSQFISVLDEAKIKQVKVYIALNTVIKNSELSQVLDLLWFLSKTSVSAVIIQDWGVYHLIKKCFPKLPIHASTQMGNHNSLGANYSDSKGFERIVLARELTKPELTAIKQNSKIELECFIHGALCYSFSGMCLFSSFIGGVGANRGLCAQLCRRSFTNSDNKYLFSLKDNQLVEELAFFKDLGIDSLKIEGRMKSAEYVYTTASAYRKALGNLKDISASKQMLSDDFGREKTAYFLGGNVSQAITLYPNTGTYLGKVLESNVAGILFESNRNLQNGFRIRFVASKTDEPFNLKIENIEFKTDEAYFLPVPNAKIKKGDQVFLIGGIMPLSFSNKIKNPERMPSSSMPTLLKQKALKSVQMKLHKTQRQLWVRVGSVEALQSLNLSSIQQIILSDSEIFKNLNPKTAIIQKYKDKIWIELPKFISEVNLPFYQNAIKNLFKKGLKQFMLSHLSQKLLLPTDARFATNENVYVFNDAASSLIKEEGAKHFTYPFEIDFSTLYSMRNRSGIVPLYFYPDLFYSRMPVSIRSEEQVFYDAEKRKYKKIVKDGMTIVRPEKAVSTLKFRPKMEQLGYTHFLLDFSNLQVSKKEFERIIKAFQKSENISETSIFNLKRDLK